MSSIPYHVRLAFGVHPMDGVDGQEAAVLLRGEWKPFDTEARHDAPLASHVWNPNQKTWLFQNESYIFLHNALVWGKRLSCLFNEPQIVSSSWWYESLPLILGKPKIGLQWMACQGLTSYQTKKFLDPNVVSPIDHAPFTIVSHLKSMGKKHAQEIGLLVGWPHYVFFLKIGTVQGCGAGVQQGTTVRCRGCNGAM